MIEAATGWELGRWLYGLTGIWIAQMLSFTPISFLVLIGVVEGVSPSMEEASQTLRADRWRTFWRVSLPLMAPGLANAFLIGFIELMADFGNPLVLGGSGGVLSTEIFFAVVGAQNDPARAAVLATVLLAFTLSAFLAQRFWLSGRNFATVSGKGDGGQHALLPSRVAVPVTTVVVIWSIFTLAIYAMILFGGFVKIWGLDNTLTLQHYVDAFGVSLQNGWQWTGVAWNSFWTTMEIALISAPLTAAVGLLTAWLIVRQNFPGRSVFEFALMMSFAIPGTVIGISYIMAFNLPPMQMTGTALILVACFVFRNMPVGVRSGVAAMAQIDQSLDEASLTLGAGSGRTLRRVDPPLMRPAILAALVYSFVRAITSISAVIFLVSAKYNMATAYIVGSGGERRIRHRDRLFFGADRRDDHDHRRLPAAGGRAPPVPTVGTRSSEGGSGMSQIRGAVALEGVRKEFGTFTAIPDLSLSIEPGQLVTLLGPSGCGKTTVLRMLAGLESPTRGRIVIGGQDVTRLPANRRDVSMVFQSYALFPHLNVADNVAYGLESVGMRPAEAKEAAERGLELVGLANFGGRLPAELSGGQQQRVAVARALVLEPQVLLLDEPLSNLDARLRRRVRTEIRELQQRLGFTAVYVTHDQEEALAVSDRIVVMREGRIAQDGTPRELYEAPASEFIADFIGEANVVDCEVVSTADGQANCASANSDSPCRRWPRDRVRASSPYAPMR